MGALTAAGRAAERLLAEKDDLARRTAEALYAALPDLQEKYGDYGRRKCLEDMHYNVEHLAPAVDLGRPELFAGYVEWLGGLLRARNVPTSEVVRSLELMEELVVARFSPEEAGSVVPCIRAGLAALGRPATP